ncbi:MAG: hypothetical protein K2N94_12525 [Lachnospiraceae bacterium]|nr:hypothetical protein [Lachnospiraceae bacterium]
MEYLTRLEGPVLGFYAGERYIDCLCGKKLQKIEKESGRVVYEREVFEKDGLARNLAAENGRIFVSDFCTLNIFHQDTYELLDRQLLGEDLSSDICGLTAEGGTIYCSVRNGRLAAVDQNSFQKKEYGISDSSMWSLRVYGSSLLCGTVDGRLLSLNRESMAVEKELRLGRQNIRSLFADGRILYAAGQDKRLFEIDLTKFEVIRAKRNVHSKMFDCAGIFGGSLVTVSHPCSEIALWNKETLEKCGELKVPLKLSGCAHIEGNKLYLSSRSICGIGLIDLNKISEKNF